MVEAAKKLCPSQYGWQSAREVEHQVTQLFFPSQIIRSSKVSECRRRSSLPVYMPGKKHMSAEAVLLVVPRQRVQASGGKVSNCNTWVLQRTKDIAKISFGAEAVNELLGGGLETKCITEMFGEFR